MKDAHLLFFFFRFKSTEEAERKQVNVLIDLIPSKLAEQRLTFQSVAMRREIIQRKQGENDDDGDVPAAAAAAEEKGVRVKIERGASPAPPFFSICRTWPRLNLPCCSRPSKTPHSWQRIIAGRRNQRWDPSLRFHLHPF